jgi:glutaredoxin
MLDGVRTLLHRAITTPAGESLAVVRVPKEIARTVNEILGEPLCSKDELARRRAATTRLQELRRAPKASPKKREPAPVMVYLEKDRNARELQKIKDVLGAHGIAPKLLDVTGDEATIAFVVRESKREADMLPIVFVGGQAVGTFRDLVAFDARGELRRAVFGD